MVSQVSRWSFYPSSDAGEINAANTDVVDSPSTVVYLEECQISSRELLRFFIPKSMKVDHISPIIKFLFIPSIWRFLLPEVG